MKTLKQFIEELDIDERLVFVEEYIANSGDSVYYDEEEEKYVIDSTLNMGEKEKFNEKWINETLWKEIMEDLLLNTDKVNLYSAIKHYRMEEVERIYNIPDFDEFNYTKNDIDNGKIFDKLENFFEEKLIEKLKSNPKIYQKFISETDKLAPEDSKEYQKWLNTDPYSDEKFEEWLKENVTLFGFKDTTRLENGIDNKIKLKG